MNPSDSGSGRSGPNEPPRYGDGDDGDFVAPDEGMPPSDAADLPLIAHDTPNSVVEGYVDMVAADIERYANLEGGGALAEQMRTDRIAAGLDPRRVNVKQGK